jgi:UDP-N-acetyl-D-mannosaminuronic acid dehydrogenase
MTQMDVSPAADRTRLQRKIEDRSAVICVVGLGYVGLTLACALAETGFRVTGIDTDAARVRQISRGLYPVRGAEPRLPEVLAEQVRDGRLRATTDYLPCHGADVIAIVVQTPIDPLTKASDLAALNSAAAAVAPYVRRGTLVLVESTIPPQTMRDVVIPLVEQGSGLSADTDFFAACCPERVMPGKLLANLAECSRVVGGWTPPAGLLAAALYRTLTSGQVDTTDCITAELVKTVENAYRDVQIAFANEIALLCEDYAADVFEVRELVNKSPFRDVHMPGAGVGGHCIPKDPWLLIANTNDRTHSRLIQTARAVNDFMPHHICDLTEQVLTECGRRLEDARLVVLGYSYLPNSEDARNTPSRDLMGWLLAGGAVVVAHDPFVAGLRIDLLEAAAGADGLILMVAHDEYRALDLELLGRRMRTRTVVDGRHFFDPSVVDRAGFTARYLGVGSSASMPRKLRPTIVVGAGK